MKDDIVTSFDFDTTGERSATIDYSGVCLISDIDSNNESFHLNMENKGN